MTGRRGDEGRTASGGRQRPPRPGGAPQPLRHGARVVHPRLLAARLGPRGALGRPRLRPRRDHHPRPADRRPRRRRRSACSRSSSLGLRRFRWPRADDARARIDATLPGRPLATLRDRPALGRDDPAAEAVWAAHLARMRRLAASARPVVADLRLAARDPWALRLMALVALVAALVFARDRGVESVAAALQAGRRPPPPPPARATRAGPSRRPIPASRRSTCPRSPATRRSRCRRAPSSPCAATATPSGSSSPRPSPAARRPRSPRPRPASPRRASRSRRAAR